MLNLPIDPSIDIACRVLLCLVFGLAVTGKLRRMNEFAGVVANYRVVPLSWAGAASRLVIGAEAVVAVSLATGFAPMSGALLAVILLCAFAVAMGVNLRRGRREIDCGCFDSALRQRLSWGLVGRNAVLVGAACLVMAGAGAGQSQVSSFLQVLDGIGAGVALFIFVQVFEQLHALRDAVRALSRSSAQ